MKPNFTIFCRLFCTATAVIVSGVVFVCGSTAERDESLSQYRWELTERLKNSRGGVPYLMAPLRWQTFGGVTLGTDSTSDSASTSTLQLIGTGGSTVGGVLSAPIPNPRTGRLFLTCTVSISETTSAATTEKHGELPLTVTLLVPPSTVSPSVPTATPREFSHTLMVGRMTPSEKIPVVLPFTQLPTDTDTFQFRVDWGGAAAVSLESIQLFQVAFTEPERLELARILAKADIFLEQQRYSDFLALLENPSIQYLRNHVPMPENTGSQQLQVAPVETSYSSNRAVPSVENRPTSPPKPTSTKIPSTLTGYWNRVKSWFSGSK